jgi:putative salt-induced outer membrane protein YdiY
MKTIIYFVSFHFNSIQAEMDMLIISILFGGSLAQAKSAPTENIFSNSDTECRVTL